MTPIDFRNWSVCIIRLSNLSDMNRQIVEMKYLLSMSMSEIALELGMTVSQVNSRIERARGKIKQTLEAEGLL
ncbi:hypothetical protein FACS1894202_08540 [Clostridia bacterium]|nr:hypothetical protein FACS1894202_08540 [Clostridia bacterium]